MTREETEAEVASTTADNDDEEQPQSSSSSSSTLTSALKLVASSALLWSAISTYRATPGLHVRDVEYVDLSPEDASHRRRLSTSTKVDRDHVPTYMKPIMDELNEREKLFEDTPPEEVKYWFEYFGPLQKYFYRYSKSRGKADYFEGRDDSGVTSARFVDESNGNADFNTFFNRPAGDIPEEEIPSYTRLLDNCLAMGSPARPKMEKGSFWYDWFGKDAEGGSEAAVLERCRVLIAINTVGAGRGPTILWETAPPLPHTSGPKGWQSEQETAALHLERNLKEIDAMCATGAIAARVQILVCEPIPGEWTDWMDSQLVHCGGKPAPLEGGGSRDPEKNGNGKVDFSVEVEDRPSPVQVVVVSSAATADTCHNLKSGFMEKRMQDIVLAPPLFDSGDGGSSAEKDKRKLGAAASSKEKFDSGVKTTHPDLISSDHHDVYIGMKWSSMVTTRALSGFLQASADLAAAAASPNAGKGDGETTTVISTGEDDTALSPFLVPSFVRVSYVSEENNKVAKWRMHGDFFHPAAWEICKDSFEMTWIPDSLSGHGGVKGVCYGDDPIETGDGVDCGQWWVYMREEQMPTTPDVYASAETKPLVQGGSNFFWMLTERQRREIVDKRICEHGSSKDTTKKCVADPQAVIPLGDLESFLINYMPNTALGKKHEKGRRPGYTVEEQRQADREKVRERKQLKGQEDIEKALFDYTIYPAALFHKDATLKAARAMDKVLSKDKDGSGIQTVKSSYYDVTIIKPRPPQLGWCQALARRGLCGLYADYLRESNDKRCREACGMNKNFTPIDEVPK